MAVSEEDQAAIAGNSSAERAGSARTSAADTASACHSFWVVQRGGASAKGWDGWAQHPGLAHLAHWKSQQLRITRVPLEPLSTGTVKTHDHARTNPSRRTTAVFARRDVIAFSLSFCFAIADRVCQGQERQ